MFQTRFRPSNILHYKTIFLITTLLLTTITLFAQNLPKIAILPISNVTENPSADSMSETAEENIIAIAKEFNDYNSFDARDNQPQFISLYLLKKEAEKRECDYIIYGRISGQGPYSISLSLYERMRNKIIFQDTASMQRKSEVSFLSEDLVINLLETLSEERETQGILKITNTGTEGSYSVRINDLQLENNLSEILLPEGEYNLRIDILSGIKKSSLFSERIKITQQKETLVEIKLPKDFNSYQSQKKNERKKREKSKAEAQAQAEAKSEALYGFERSTALVRFNVGALLSSEVDASDFKAVPLGDELIFALSFSTCNSLGVGFTGGIRIGAVGVWKYAGIYDYTPGFLPNSSFSSSYTSTTKTPTQGVSFGFELGPYFRANKILGIYPVFTIDLISATVIDFLPSPQFATFGGLVGFDIFILKNVPFSVELGINVGSIEFLDDKYTQRLGYFVSIGVGYSFF